MYQGSDGIKRLSLLVRCVGEQAGGMYSIYIHMHTCINKQVLSCFLSH